jgi:L-ascorbate metabolism protein UlaG (beta-lactamase superfamily)
MKITKYVHSCLLVETADRVGLIDPGNYSWDSGTFDINQLERLDDIVITHEHPDHMYLPFIQALVEKFPGAQIITTQPASEQLIKAGITNVSTQPSDVIELFEASHESMEPLTPPPPANIGIHYLGKLTHPGDCHHFPSAKAVLALPITAPWGTVARAAQLIQELKPQYVVPIHDWHYRDEARSGSYDRLDDFCKTINVTMIKPVDGKAVELDSMNK